MKTQLIKDIWAEYPKVGRALETFWGYKEFNDHVDGLLTDSRGGRKGFSATALSNIIKLKNLHDQEFPELNPEPTGWASTFY
jgi:hypothetical protein